MHKNKIIKFGFFWNHFSLSFPKMIAIMNLVYIWSVFKRIIIISSIIYYNMI